MKKYRVVIRWEDDKARPEPPEEPTKCRLCAAISNLVSYFKFEFCRVCILCKELLDWHIIKVDKQYYIRRLTYRGWAYACNRDADIKVKREVQSRTNETYFIKLSTALRTVEDYVGKPTVVVVHFPDIKLRYATSY